MSAHSPPRSITPSRSSDSAALMIETAIEDIARHTGAVLMADSVNEPRARAGLAHAVAQSELIIRRKVSTYEARDAKARLCWVRGVAKMILETPPRPDREGTEPPPVAYDDEPLDSCRRERTIRQRHPTVPQRPIAIAAAIGHKGTAPVVRSSGAETDPDSALDVRVRR